MGRSTFCHVSHQMKTQNVAAVKNNNTQIPCWDHWKRDWQWSTLSCLHKNLWYVHSWTATFSSCNFGEKIWQGQPRRSYGEKVKMLGEKKRNRERCNWGVQNKALCGENRHGNVILPLSKPGERGSSNTAERKEVIDKTMKHFFTLFMNYGIHCHKVRWGPPPWRALKRSWEKSWQPGSTDSY